MLRLLLTEGVSADQERTREAAYLIFQYKIPFCRMIFFTFVINYIDKLTSVGEEKIQDEEWWNVLKQAIVFLTIN
ncbi:polysaccharide deacetylase family protein [Coxiella endosymbiont of Ornithodoros maritimus]|uniref:hypothetical protein n=1 Tax=Coxiella endosymbiont of Ornithodoros maritimus TaxID=1656172 RepID=UPI0022640E10|nr:hypothetical protein [Coxiella endosymbiont of Ornithodoros maritimus]